MDPSARFRSDGMVGALLIAITLAVFWPVQHYPFLRLDDDAYVFENPRVNTGLAAANLRWAFTAMHSGNWHPLTWISHQLDVQIYGLALADITAPTCCCTWPTSCCFTWVSGD